MNARTITCLALLTLIPLSGARAQESIEPGSRLRVTAPEIAEKPITGFVTSIESDSIRLETRRGGLRSEHVVPLHSVRRIEIGHRNHSPLPGMGKGFLVGAGAGLVLGIAAATEEDNWVCDGGRCVLLGTFSGALWGTVIGGLFGAAIGQVEWEDAPALRPTVTVAPKADGVALAVSLKL